jgi:hypothetical protein
MARYAAFISYSHADERWARWLQQSLERYRVPRQLRRERSADRTLPARLYPVFRDRDEFASSDDLNAAIQAALDDSDASSARAPLFEFSAAWSAPAVPALRANTRSGATAERFAPSAPESSR